MLRELNINEMEIVSGGSISGGDDPWDLSKDSGGSSLGDVFGQISDYVGDAISDAFYEVGSITGLWGRPANTEGQNLGVYNINEFTPAKNVRGLFTRDNQDGTVTNLIDRDGDGIIDYAETFGNGIYTSDTDMDGSPNFVYNVPGL